MLPSVHLSAASEHGLSMNYTTDFKSIRADVSAEEWQTRVDLAACYRLLEAEDRHSRYPPYWH
jgi:hypothetical protein